MPARRFNLLRPTSPPSSRKPVRTFQEYCRTLALGTLHADATNWLHCSNRPRNLAPVLPGKAGSGLGLTPATLTATPAFWPSWAGALPVVQHQPPALPTLLFEQLAAQPIPTPHIQAAQQARAHLQQHARDPAACGALANSRPPPCARHGSNSSRQQPRLDSQKPGPRCKTPGGPWETQTEPCLTPNPGHLPTEHWVSSCPVGGGHLCLNSRL